MKINKISPDNNNFLQITSYIAKPPKSLYVTGKIPDQRTPAVAIVGSRKPTPYGREVTERFARELAQKGITIVSGLALGVDAIAHQSVLDAGGHTIAVLANGLPAIYPATNRALGERIIKEGGALISEYEPETPARSFQFLERNRLVSALSDAILITEAASRSGTLNTAMHALEQGKEVFVIPGNITSPMSAGCNALLQQGAHVALTPDDIAMVVAPYNIVSQQELPLGKTPEEATLISLLQTGIRDGDELQRQSGIDAATFSMTLTMMELAGIIRPLGANQWTLR